MIFGNCKTRLRVIGASMDEGSTKPREQITQLEPMQLPKK
jgi:hypothetical protein